jgi:hypothetical protein
MIIAKDYIKSIQSFIKRKGSSQKQSWRIDRAQSNIFAQFMQKLCTCKVLIQLAQELSLSSMELQGRFAQ